MHVNMYEEVHKLKSARKLPATLLDALRMDYILDLFVRLDWCFTGVR